ncbi:hypothetical protein MED222_05775 [Vibrio sp. MED222]|nr:hypothetical protein MED222_05775 [Vibrio sp. MED222]
MHSFCGSLQNNCRSLQNKLTNFEFLIVNANVCFCFER